MLAEGAESAATLITMGRLVERLAGDLKTARQRFAGRFAELAQDTVRADFQALFGGDR